MIRSTSPSLQATMTCCTDGFHSVFTFCLESLHSTTRCTGIIFSSFSAESWDKFKADFPGNTSDMSDALRISFFVVTMYAMEKFGHVIAESELIEMFGFCKVHFDKSSRRVASNSGVVHVAKQDLFDESVRLLLSYRRGQFSQFLRGCKH